MNTVKDKGFRGFAIAALLLFGVATTIATGGGGSDGRSILDPDAPPVTIGPSLAITTANGATVASTVVIAVGISFEIGDLTGDGIPIMAVGRPVAAPGPKDFTGLYTKLLGRNAEAIESCALGGTVDVTMTVADPNTLTIGDRVVAVFTNCDDGDGFVIDGTIDLTIADVQGDIFTDVFLVEMDITLVDIAITEVSETLTADGDFTLTLDRLDFPASVMRLEGSELALGAAGDVVTLTDFDHFYEIGTGVYPGSISAGAEGRLESRTLGGTVDYETPVPVQALYGFDPDDGVMLITGDGGSTVRIDIVDNTRVTLEIDADGDGVIDEYRDTTWPELTGDTSVIDAAAVPTLAREVFNGVTGFASVATAPGTLFAPLGPFGQLQAIGIAGEFGPLQLGCETGGTAVVSGTKFTPNTFTEGDEFDAAFAACGGADMILDGEMSLSVSDFDESAVGAYLVFGTVTGTDLQNTMDERCFTANGVFDINHDQRPDSTGVDERRSAAAEAFRVFAGGRGQSLTDARVSERIRLRDGSVSVEQTSSGQITSEDLDGTYRYASVWPFVFDLDDNAETWAYFGELLVTATDGSTMRMIADADELRVHLVMDYDGDSTVDEVLETTWAALSYPPWICEPF